MKNWIALIIVLFVLHDLTHSQTIIPPAPIPHVDNPVVVVPPTVVIPDEPDIIKPSIPVEPKIVFKATKIEPIKNSAKPTGTNIDNVLNKAKKPYLKGDNKYTNVHETVHFIHSDYQNKYLGKYSQVFYIYPDSIYLLEANPKFKLSDVAKAVPESLRSMRYELYLKNTGWENEPFYTFDEWMAYLTEAELAYENVSNGEKPILVDQTSGALELAIYSSVAMMLTAEKNPEFFKKNPDFPAFFRYNLDRTQRVLERSKDIKEWRNDKDIVLWNNLSFGSKAEKVRKFLNNNFDGVLINGEKRKN